MIGRWGLAFLPLGFAAVGCAAQSGGDAPTEQPQVFTRTIVSRAADGTESVTAFEVKRLATGVEETRPLGRVVADAKGGARIEPDNCPGCGAGSGACDDAALRIFDNGWWNRSFSGNELCFSSPGIDYNFFDYCRVWNFWTGACASQWSGGAVKSFITPSSNPLYSCFRGGTLGFGISYPSDDWVTAPNRQIFSSPGVALSAEPAPYCVSD
jgi:hypothetical protein